MECEWRQWMSLISFIHRFPTETQTIVYTTMIQVKSNVIRGLQKHGNKTKTKIWETKGNLYGSTILRKNETIKKKPKNKIWETERNL